MVALGTVVPFQNGGVIQGVFSEFALHASVSFEVTSYSASTVKQGEMIVSGSGTAVWDMSAHATDPENHSDRGSFALNVFATGNQIPLGDGAVWAHAQGNLTGTLPAETNTGASGDIQPTQAMRKLKQPRATYLPGGFFSRSRIGINSATTTLSLGRPAAVLTSIRVARSSTRKGRPSKSNAVVCGSNSSYPRPS